MSITDAGDPRRTRGPHHPGTKSSPLPPEVRIHRAGPTVEASRPRLAAAPSALALVHNLAAQDWLLVGYLSPLVLALVFGVGHGRLACIQRVSADLAVFVTVLAIVRLPLLRWGGMANSLLYRFTLIGVVLGSFFQLRDILPAVSPWADDARIYAFDVRVFGVEPSVWLDRFVTPATTEWFAFFYFLYFLILTTHVLPMLFGHPDTLVLARFALGLLLVFTTAHLLYMVVPGWGPYWYLRGTFRNELQGGIFWNLVREAVDAGGAQKDIFPSLHTAAPTFLAIFSFRHRRLSPFKYSWPLIAFFATQIIVATLFLRWHYLVDVIAGLILAGTAAVVGDRIANWESAKRTRLGRQPAWTPPFYPWSR